MAQASTPQFVELCRLGGVEVPMNHVSRRDPPCVVPGESFEVSVFRQATEGRTTLAERLAFLAQQNAVLVGFFGVIALYRWRKTKTLSTSLTYLSFDERSVAGEVGALCVVAGACIGHGGKWYQIFLGNDNGPITWFTRDDAFLCFQRLRTA